MIPLRDIVYPVRRGKQRFGRRVDALGPIPPANTEDFCEQVAVELRIGRTPRRSGILGGGDRRHSRIAPVQPRLNRDDAARESMPGGNAARGEMISAPYVVSAHQAG